MSDGMLPPVGWATGAQERDGLVQQAGAGAAGAAGAAEWVHPNNVVSPYALIANQGQMQVVQPGAVPAGMPQGTDTHRVLFAPPHTPQPNAGLAPPTYTPQQQTQATVTSKGAVETALSKRIATQTAHERNQEFGWQKSKGDAQRAEYKEQLLAFSPDVRACAFVQKGSTVIKVAHGMTKYFGDAAKEYNGKVLARLGEWTADTIPFVLAMPDLTTWAWEEFSVGTDAVAWAAFCEDPANGVKPWSPGAAPVSTMKLPRVLYLPPVLAHFLMAGDKTACEFYKHLGQMETADPPVVDAEQLEFYKEWALAAGQYVPGQTAHRLSIEVDPVTNVSPQFLHWTTNQLLTYLERPGGMTSNHPTPPAAAAAPDSYLQSVTSVLTQLVAKQSSEQVENEKKKELAKGLTEFQTAALMGFACIDDPAQKPVLYQLLPACNCIEDVRATVMRLLDQWAYDERREIDRGIHLTDEIIKGIMKVSPNPLGIVATSEPCDKVFSNLACLPRRMEQLQKIRLAEKVAKETEATRTLKDAEKLCKADVRAPPTTYARLKCNISTTQGLTEIVYGKKCRVAVGLQELYDMLNTRESHALQDHLTPMHCKQITWAIYDAMRSYFSTRLMPQDFLTGTPDYPVCLLPDLNADVRFQREVYRSTFPPSWRDQQKAASPTTPTAKEPAYTPRSTPFAAYVQNPSAYLPGTPDLSNINPRLKLALKKYHDKFGGDVRMGQLVEVGGLRWSDIPCLDGHRNSKTNHCETCWYNILGECKNGDRCHFAKNHIQGSALPKEYVDDLIKVVVPPMMKMVDENIPLQKGRRTNSRDDPNKRPRR